MACIVIQKATEVSNYASLLDERTASSGTVQQAMLELRINKFTEYIVFLTKLHNFK